MASAQLLRTTCVCDAIKTLFIISIRTQHPPNSISDAGITCLTYSAKRWVKYWLFFEKPHAVGLFQKQLPFIQLKIAGESRIE
jgi:hypothetical protein